MHVHPVVCFAGFHAVDLDSASVNDLFIPSQVSSINKFLTLAVVTSEECLFRRKLECEFQQYS